MEILHQEYEKVEALRAETAGVPNKAEEKQPLGSTL